MREMEKEEERHVELLMLDYVLMNIMLTDTENGRCYGRGEG